MWGSIYGKPVTHGPGAKGGQSEILIVIEDDAMNAMGLRTLLMSLATPAQSEGDAKANFLWNGMVLKHESETLGIQPTGG